MICQRSGNCCITMGVAIPVQVNGEWRARWKPHGVKCPHLSFEGSQAACAVHSEPVYQGSPCWTYGNHKADIDFANSERRPCGPGELIQKRGGLLKVLPTTAGAPQATAEELDDIGPWVQSIAPKEV